MRDGEPDAGGPQGLGDAASLGPTDASPPSAARVLRTRLLHVPRNPFEVGPDALESWDDGALVIDGAGFVRDVGDASTVLERNPGLAVIDARDAMAIPGLVDAHVHYPQVGVMAGLGLPLLRWLAERALPHEAAFADEPLAEREARAFVRLLAANGTTSALVFGAHFPAAMQAFFAAAAESGLRLCGGLVLSDRLVPEVLRSTPERAYRESAELAERWHGKARLRYAVTPRFALSCSDEMLAACGALASERPELLVTSHLNESEAEIAGVRASYPADRDYLAVYERHGLVREASVFAHDVHPTDDELSRLTAAGAAVAHCPSSNASLGSGSFSMRRHLRAGVPFSLGSDVGAGTSLSMLNEALHAYSTQAALGESGEPLGPAHLLWLITRAGAEVIGLGGLVGDLSPGRAADLVLLRAPDGSTLENVLSHADGPAEALAACLMLGREDAVSETWVQGRVVHRRVSPARFRGR